MGGVSVGNGHGQSCQMTVHMGVCFDGEGRTHDAQAGINAPSTSSSSCGKTPSSESLGMGPR